MDSDGQRAGSTGGGTPGATPPTQPQGPIGFPALERHREAFEIGRIRRVADVQVAREARVCLHHDSDATDDDKVDLPLRKDAQQRRGAELRPARHDPRHPQARARAPGDT